MHNIMNQPVILNKHLVSSPMSTLAGKTVVIIGGTSGIGFGVAKAAILAQAAHVIAVSSTPAKVERAVRRLQEVASSASLPGKVSGQVLDA